MLVQDIVALLKAREIYIAQDNIYQKIMIKVLRLI